jgi:hypothetical protein
MKLINKFINLLRSIHCRKTATLNSAARDMLNMACGTREPQRRNDTYFIGDFPNGFNLLKYLEVSSENYGHIFYNLGYLITALKRVTLQKKRNVQP